MFNYFTMQYIGNITDIIITDVSKVGIQNMYRFERKIRFLEHIVFLHQF